MFDQETRKAVARFAQALRVEEAALLAVVEIESAGHIFAEVNGKREPLIRWEGHYFDRRLSGAEREEARALGLAHPTAGRVANPRGQAARWALLQRASAINARAALESCSWGAGQVMGGHWEWLGFPSVDAMVNLARSGAAGQIELMVRFIDKAGLVGALRRKDWVAFARGYNGPGYARNSYDTRMAAAYRRWSGRPGPVSDGMLRMGSRGARVRELQTLLLRAGYALTVDGDFGQATDRAVRAFQGTNNLKVDGVAGPQTMAALDRYRQSPEERPGEQKVSEVPEVKDASKGGVVMGLIIAMRDQIAGAAETLTGIDGATAQTLANWLLAGSAVIGIGLTAWAILGVLRSRRTEEGR